MHRNKHINWDDLRYLRAALQAGSLAAAARVLRVEHTTIGRRLSALEKNLGAALVIRSANGLRPTALGSELAPLLDDFERAAAAVRALVLAQRCHVRVATPSGFAALFTANLTQLRARDPEISVELVSGARPVDLHKGDADLAVRIGPVIDDNLVMRKLGEVGWALYASSDYLARAGGVDVADLAGHDIIGFENTLADSPPARWLDARVANARVVMRGREMVDLRDAAVAGLGLAVLSCYIGNAEPTLIRLTPDDVATRPISIVYRRDARISPAVRTVIAFVIDVITANVTLMSGAPSSRASAPARRRAQAAR